MLSDFHWLWTGTFAEGGYFEAACWLHAIQIGIVGSCLIAWGVSGYPIRRKRKAFAATSSTANTYEKTWFLNGSSITSATPLTPHGEWQEYLHDAEFMDLDLFVEKWRDRKKPERPRAPVICNYRDGCRNLMASNAPCCDSCDLKNQREFLARNDEANARAEAYAKEALAAQVKAVKETEDERLARLALKLSDVQRESIRRRYQSGLCKCDKGWGACIAAHKCPNCGDWCI